MKKVLALALAVILVLSMAACGAKKDPAQTNVPGNSIAAPGTTAAPTTGTVEKLETEPTETEPPVTTPTETEPTEPAPTETVPSESVTVTEPEGEFFTKTGTIQLGTADGTTYTNASVGMTCALDDGMPFSSEAAILEVNEVATVEEALSKNEICLTVTIDGSLIVAAYKRGSEGIGGNSSVWDSLMYLAEDDIRSLGIQVEDMEASNVIFTAGNAQALLVTGTMDGIPVVILYTGYLVGDYVIAIGIQAQNQSNVEEILLGVDVE